jgi:hypothetical protein
LVTIMDQFNPLWSILNLCYIHRDQIMWRRFLQSISYDQAIQNHWLYRFREGASLTPTYMTVCYITTDFYNYCDIESASLKLFPYDQGGNHVLDQMHAMSALLESMIKIRSSEEIDDWRNFSYGVIGCESLHFSRLAIFEKELNSASSFLYSLSM